MCAILRRDVVTVEVEVEGGYGLTEEVEETVFVFVGGASLISPGVVLTGAHKVDKYSDPASLVVRCGEWDTQTESEIKPHQNRNVSRLVIHPEFNPRSLWNSIAVLFLGLTLCWTNISTPSVCRSIRRTLMTDPSVS